MNSQRRIVVLLRWVTFSALAYLLWASGGVLSWPPIVLLALMAATNVALARASPARWEHPALLPAVALVDIGLLAASMLVGQGFARDFFFAYWVILAAVALVPNLRWGSLVTALGVGAYGGFLALGHGAALLQEPALLGRLGFLFSVGVAYGGLTETGKIWLREAGLRNNLVVWVGKLSEAFSDEFDSFEVIRQILMDLQSIYPMAVRASVVQIVDEEVRVLSSSDDAGVRELELDPSRYPELIQVVESGEPLVIDDLREHHAALGNDLTKLEFNSLLLCPVSLGDPTMGHVVLRVARRSAPFTPGIIRTTQQVAEAIAVIFRQARVREVMERSHQMELVSQITTSVSHNFNDLLSSILLASESLRRQTTRRGDVEPAAVQKFEAIELAVKEGMTIVERLAAWTRLERDASTQADDGGRVLEPTRLLEEAWRYAQPHWQRREATRELELKLEVAETRSVVGRLPELREVLLNLILNAIDAMPKGGTLLLGVEEAGEEIRFLVEDSGLGMSEEQLERAFDPLYTTKGSGGTGLGLTIARSVARRYGGEIEAESRIGVGSRFTLRLPATDALPAQSQDLDDEPQETPGRPRVLLVDSNQLVRDVMVRMLQTRDYEVDAVESPDEALVMIGTGRRYRGLLVDAETIASRAESFLGELDAAINGFASRMLVYSSNAQSEDWLRLQEQYRFGYVDRSAGLAALTQALASQLGRPDREEAA